MIERGVTGAVTLAGWSEDAERGNRRSSRQLTQGWTKGVPVINNGDQVQQTIGHNDLRISTDVNSSDFHSHNKTVCKLRNYKLSATLKRILE